MTVSGATARSIFDLTAVQLLEAHADAIVIVDPTGTIVLVNERAVTLFGYPREELVGEPVEMLVPSSLRDRHRGHRASFSADPYSRPMGAGHALLGRRKDGTEFPCEVSLSRLTTDAGLLITSTIVDITPRKRAEAALREAEERFRLAFEQAPIGMALVALHGRLQRVNRALCLLTGYGEDALLERSIDDLAHPEDIDADLEHMRDLLVGAINSYRVEKRLLTAAGHTVWTLLSVSVVRDAEGGPLHFIAQLEDVSERKLMEGRLRRLADYDSLTGVRNRRQFEHDLGCQLESCRRYGEQAALLMIDLDQFKQINDTFGHKVGDDLLRAVATAVRRRLRATDKLARLGGDEFAVLLPHIGGARAASVAADLERCVAAATVNAGGISVSVGASIGIAQLDQKVGSTDAIVAVADEAMYARKRARACVPRLVG